jgi:hypothetical protein
MRIYLIIISIFLSFCGRANAEEAPVRDGQKLAIRGNMTVSGLDDLPEEQKEKEIKSVGWGKYTLDRAFRRAPRVFKDFAVKRWNELKGQDDFSQL